MDEFITIYEPTIRLGIFIAFFLLLSLLELVAPKRTLKINKPKRWINNWAISIFNAIFLRVALPLTAIGMTIFAQNNHWGLLNHIILPAWVEVIIFIFLFDLAIYFQHRLVHMQSLLWRLHRMHHTDLDYDVTTGNRFHPIEMFISMLIKLLLIVSIGPPLIAILIAEILLNVTSMFNHSNIHIPVSTDKILRQFVVTPDMHRIHHSTLKKEHNRNFGFNFPWWDRLFGTYLEQPKEGHKNMDIGLTEFQNEKSIKFQSLLVQPFVNLSDDKRIIDK